RLAGKRARAGQCDGTGRRGHDEESSGSGGSSSGGPHRTASPQPEGRNPTPGEDRERLYSCHSRSHGRKPEGGLGGARNRRGDAPAETEGVQGGSFGSALPPGGKTSA